MVENILWGLWNGLTAWPLLILHVFGVWDRFPVYNVARDGGWYQFGFLLGAGSPFFGFSADEPRGADYEPASSVRPRPNGTRSCGCSTETGTPPSSAAG